MDTGCIYIGDRPVGAGHPCYVIAEVSANHKQSYDEAVAIVKAAAAAGADAIKLQTYTPDTITIDCDKPLFLVDGEDIPGAWKKSLYSLYGTAYTPWEWHAPLKKVALEAGLQFFSTPFDETAVTFLDELDVPCFKIASYEATHTPLLRKVAATGKPVIISVGFATMEEIEAAVKTLREGGARDIAVLHCCTTYSDLPQPEDMRLSTIRDIAERFGTISGFSDNNAGIEFPIMAVAAGASIVEKHIITDKGNGGLDARFSLDASEFKAMVDGIRRVDAALGKAHYGPASAREEHFRSFRRSVFVVSDVSAGEVFDTSNLRVIRPGQGLPPSCFDTVLGKRAAQAIERGTPLSWELVSRED